MNAPPVSSPPAVAPERGDVVNVAACLPQIAAAQPERLALAEPAGAGGRYRELTYRQLDEQSDQVARGLAAIGIGQGVRAVLMVPPGPHFFSLAFGMAKAGVVPVMIDPGLPRKHLAACIDEAAPEAFIGSPKAHVARALFGWGQRTVGMNVVVGGSRVWGGRAGVSWSEVLRRGAEARGPALAPTRAEDVAAILFTSGSTGVPKGAVYTQANFAAQVAAIREIAGLGDAEIDLPTFPLFALFDPALGMSTVVPQMDFTRPARANPRRILRALTARRVTNMFASPALLRTLVRYAVPAGERVWGLRRIVSAGAPVSPALVKELLQLMPNGKVVTPYGATEALPVAVIESDEILRVGARSAAGQGICVGRPVAGVDVAIIPLHDEPIGVWRDELRLPPPTRGEIVVRGPQVTRSYWGRPQADALAKIPTADGVGFWHRMGDVGAFDDEGRLWFCGRKAHRVVLADGHVLFSVACEGVFNAHPAVRRSALVGVTLGGETHSIVCVERDPAAGAWPRLATALRALGQACPETQRIHHFLAHPGFPVDIRHNAKIDREALALWARGRVS
ncbi:MAG: AMP-binding protein [Myxococcales bacterium]|nr:AMP-binding protein [Myxococcales bacterium]